MKNRQKNKILAIKQIMKVLYVIALMLLFKYSEAQDFEGTIEIVTISDYSNFEMPNSKICIKKNSLRLVTNVNHDYRYVIVSDTGFFMVDNVEKQIVKSMRKKVDPLLPTADYLKKHATKKKKKRKILGYDCTIYNCKRVNRGVEQDITYWIADSIQASFNLNGMVKGVGIVLKIVSKSEMMELNMEAIEIIEKELDDKLFELPNYPIRNLNVEKIIEQYPNGYKGN